MPCPRLYSMTKFINRRRSPGNPKSGKATICPIRKVGELRGRRHRGAYFRTITDDVGHRPWGCHDQNLIDRRFDLRDTMVAAYPVKLVPRWIYRKNIPIVAMLAQVLVNLRIVLPRRVSGANSATERGLNKASARIIVQKEPVSTRLRSKTRTPRSGLSG